MQHPFRKLFLNLSVFSIFTFFGCGPALNLRINIQDGKLDLRQYNFQKQGIARLQGQWNFVWQEFPISDSKGQTPPSFAKAELMKVPSTWKNQTISSQKLPGIGFATYRLVVLLPPYIRHYGLEIPAIESAYRLYVNRELVQAVGEIGKTKETTIPAWKNALVLVESQTPEMEIILEMANFHHTRGGMSGTINLAPQEMILKNQNANLSMDLFLIGSLSIISLYYFVIYILRTKDKSAIYFSCFCLLVLARISSVGEHTIYSFFPKLDFETIAKVKYLGFMMPTPLFLYFVKSLYPKQTNLRFFQVAIFLNAVFVILVFFTKVLFFSILSDYYYLFLIFPCIFVTYIFIRAVVAKERTSWITLFGWIFFFSTILNDILHIKFIINTAYLYPYGVFVFVFSQSWALAYRFSQAFTSVEALSTDLENFNSDLEKKIQVRTKELNETLTELRNNNLLAKKIQRSLVPDHYLENQYFRIATHFEPLDEVGGDIFKIDVFSDDVCQIMLADATGHGVQGALVSMGIFSEYDYVKGNHSPLEQIMEKINFSFMNRYKSIDSFFSLVLFSFKKDLIEFSFAAHPEQYLLRNSEIIELHQRGKLMGFDITSKFSSSQIQFQKSDRVILFSDGLYENYNYIQDKKYGEDKLKELIIQHKDLELKEYTNRILTEMKSSSYDGVFADDVTLVVIEKK